MILDINMDGKEDFLDYMLAEEIFGDKSRNSQEDEENEEYQEDP